MNQFLIKYTRTITSEPETMNVWAEDQTEAEIRFSTANPTYKIVNTKSL